MKKSIIIIAMFVFTALNTFAQKNSILSNEQGQHALLFSLSGLDNLGAANFQGGCGYQYYIIENLAVRASISASNEETITYPTKDNAIKTDKEVSSIRFSPGIKYGFSSSSSILGYVGAEFQYSIFNEKLNVVEQGDITNQENTKNDLALGLFLGAEWFAWENVSLSAEYKFHYSVSSGKTSISTSSGKEDYKLPQSNKLNFGTSQFALTISFYLN